MKGLREDELVAGYERAVLGACLWPDAGLLPALRAEEFFLDRHRLMWTAAMACSPEGHAPGLQLLTEYLAQHGTLEQVGGRVYLVQLLEESAWAIPSLVPEYARHVREAATRRQLRQLGAELRERGYSHEEVERRLSAIPRPALVRPYSAAAEWERMQAMWGRPRVVFALPGLDRKLGGLYPGDFCVVAGRTSHGKTSLLVSMALALLEQEQMPVAYFSLETPAMGVVRRFIAAKARVRIAQLRTGALGQSEFVLAQQAAEWLDRMPLVVRDVMDIGSKSAERILATLAGEPAPVVVVDHLQEVITDHRESRAYALGWFCSRLKELALRGQKVVLVASQIRRRPEAGTAVRRPRLDDLKESGGIEERADAVVIAHYRHKEGQDKAGPNELDLWVDKNRDGGTGKVTVQIRPEYGLVLPAEEPERVPEWVSR